MWTRVMREAEQQAQARGRPARVAALRALGEPEEEEGRAQAHDQRQREEERVQLPLEFLSARERAGRRGRRGGRRRLGLGLRRLLLHRPRDALRPAGVAPRELAAAKDVKSMPTILFFRDGNLVKRIVGADVTAIKSEVDKATMNPVLKLLKSETVSLADQLRASLPQT